MIHMSDNGVLEAYLESVKSVIGDASGEVLVFQVLSELGISKDGLNEHHIPMLWERIERDLRPLIGVTGISMLKSDLYLKLKTTPGIDIDRYWISYDHVIGKE